MKTFLKMRKEAKCVANSLPTKKLFLSPARQTHENDGKLFFFLTVKPTKESEERLLAFPTKLSTLKPEDLLTFGRFCNGNFVRRSQVNNEKEVLGNAC